MTIGGFIIMALIVFAVFALWYRYVHRDGVYNAAAPEDDKRMADMQGTNRPRPTKTKAVFGTETGTIGERKDRDGYTSSSFEYMGENAAVTDDSSKNNDLFSNGRGQVDQQVMKSDQSRNSLTPVKSAQNSAQAFQNQAQQGQGLAASGNQQFQTEVGSIGGKKGQDQPQAAKTAKSSAQVFQSEVGTIGDVQRGQAGAVGKNQDPNQVLPGKSSVDMAKDSYRTEFGVIGNASGSQGQGQQRQQRQKQQGANASANQQYSSEIGSIGGTDQVPGRSKRPGSNAAQTQGQLASLYAAEGSYGPHNYTAEVGAIGEADLLQEPPAHRAARQQLQAQHHKYSVEAGEIGYNTYPDQLGLAQTPPKNNKKNRKKNKK
jgi:hypothetical protein